MLDENTGKFSGKVEADETYIGGANKASVVVVRAVKLSLLVWLRDKQASPQVLFPMSKPIPLFP